MIDEEIKKIVAAKANNKVTCDSDPNFYLRYKNVSVGSPQTVDERMVKQDITPQQCRLRDMTYSAPVMVDVEYTKGKEIITTHNVCIGKIPLMLRSSRCCLRNKGEDELARLGECPLDPGGYFVVKGVEKVILIQEQLSKNRVIIERDAKGLICASVTSSTNERKSKTNVVQKSGKLYLKHNTFQEDIPIVIALKAMGLESDQELMQKAAGGSDPLCMSLLAPSLQECAALDVFTQSEALEYCGQRIRASQWRLAAIAGKDGKAAAAAVEASEGPTPGQPTTMGVNNNANNRANANKNIDGIAPTGKENNLNANHININRRTRSDEARDIFAGVVLAHVPVEDYDFRGKSAYVCVMIRRILLANLNPEEIDDKDYYGNKRLELAGQLLALLFEDCFKRLNADLKRQADAVLSKANRAQQFDVVKCIRQDTISNGLEHAISTGNWTIKRFRMERKGVTQVLSRLSFISALGMMTRITSQFEKTRKVSGPRALQPSQWGMLCPSDTPEGESCGLVKNLALMTHVTTDSDELPLRKLAQTLGCEPLEFLAGEELHQKGSALVLLNGSILGSVSHPIDFAQKFRKLRRSGRISEFVSVHVTKGFVHIASDGGRVCRPLIVVDETTGRLKLKQKHLDALKNKEWVFEDFLKRGYVEYLDVNEENDAYIALHERDLVAGAHTHCEIEPFTLLGVCAGIIPFPHHNQSPRNTYQCAMGKQAMGNLAFNQLNRMDTLMYTLCSAQKPLVTTKTIELIQFDRLGAGQNAVIAVLSNTGYDIEDAVVINRASLDRGFGRCQVSRKYSATMKKYANRTQDKVLKPSMDQMKRMRNYRVLDSDGYAQVGVRIRNKDIYINKHMPKNTRDPLANPEQLPDREFRPAPQVYRGPEVDGCVVDKVLLTVTDENQFVVKTLVRHTRRPEVGDKFSSRHGQKGVVGAILPQEDFPITERGICPDLVMNPHGFPSRMTVGKLIELLAGKAASEEGTFRDASAFASNDITTSTAAGTTNKNEYVDEIGEALLKAGYASDGKETLICGLTGEYLQARIFTGPVYYQKLKHMVLDKMHARARGPRVVLTRQPTEGRARQGGLRLGEMERDCLIGYGASALVLERLMISADVFDAQVCVTCGLLAYRDKASGRDCCHSCGVKAEVATLKVPYACKLLFQELQSMNICPRIALDEA